MRSYFAILITVALILGWPAYSQANPSTNLIINKQVHGEAPLIRDNRAFVPLRLVSENLGANVKWDPSARTIDVSNTRSEIRLFLNSPLAFMNAQRLNLDSAPFLVGDRTYVPLRFVATGLGATVHYDAPGRTVSISTPANGAGSVAAQGAVPEGSQEPGTNVRDYYAAAGDTLYTIAQMFNTTTAAIKETNRLRSDLITPGQLLYVPVNSTRPATASRSLPAGRTRSGYGELLEWKYANWLFNHNSTAVIFDIWSGKRFSIYRIGGSYHADCEPLTAQDTAVMESIYGGEWSWYTRPVIVEVEGRRLAASINGMPHGFDTVPNNSFNGMFCVHFWKSRNHNTGRENPNHQLNVQRAAGLK